MDFLSSDQIFKAIPQREIWVVDFEFNGSAGESPNPVCLVALELRTNRLIRLWRDDMISSPPYSVDENSLLVAFFASAELDCHASLGWDMPKCVLDLFVEFRNHTNGTGTIAGNSLVGAPTHFGLDHIGAHEKTEMRELILSGGPWSQEQKRSILDYCHSDVLATARLLPELLPTLKTGALFRGRYMTAVARMQHWGIPIDTDIVQKFQTNWDTLKAKLIAEVDQQYNVFDGTTFKTDRFESWLIQQGIPWESTITGRLKLDDKTFGRMSELYPQSNLYNNSDKSYLSSD